MEQPEKQRLSSASTPIAEDPCVRDEDYVPLLEWLKGHEAKYPLKVLNLLATVGAVIVAGIVGWRQVGIMNDQATTGREQKDLQTRQQMAQESQEEFMRNMIYRPALNCFYSEADRGVAMRNGGQHGIDLLAFSTVASGKLEPGALGGTMHLAPQGAVGDGYSVLYIKDLEKKMNEFGLPYGKSLALPFTLFLRGADEREWELELVLLKMELEETTQYKVQQRAVKLVKNNGD